MKAKRHGFHISTILEIRNNVLMTGVLCCTLAFLFLAQLSRSQTDATAFSSMEAKTRRLTYSEGWNRNESVPAFVAFHSWANRFIATSDTTARATMLSEGLILSRQRRAGFVALLNSDPAQAISSAVPASIRQQLPAEILSQLEVRVSGMGDLSVLGVLPAQRGPAVEPLQRLVRLNGRTYRAHVYGRRTSQTTKLGIPLHGVALDDDLALHESVLRELEPGEAPDAAKPVIDLRSPAEQAISEATPIFAEMSGKIYRFASPERLRQAETRLEAAEEGIGPNPSRPAADVLEISAQVQNTAAAAASAWTTGNKKILIIRVDFSDLPGDPKSIGGGTTYTAAYVQNLADTQISPYYLQSSYALTSLTNTVTIQVYRMPQTAAYYAVNNANTQLHSDAETAAAANYTLSDYDRIIVLFSWLGSISGSGITYGGLGQVGGPDVWANGEFDFRVVAHELGHTYGLWHANLWQVADGDPISTSGSSTEYGDDFDTMGANFANDLRTDFNPWFKNTLGWIPDTQVLTVISNATYRIYRFDNGSATGTLALRISKDSTHNYWIGCRRNFADNTSMQNGAYIIWGYNVNQHSDLLDMTTPGNSDQDAALAVGTTFTDSAASVIIWPMAEGGTTPHEYVDVEVAITYKDSVGDMIPDWWRAQYFGGNGATTNRQSCATCDADGTGQNNLFKYVAGLDPTNPASFFVLKIASVNGQPSQKSLIYNPIATGRTYTPQFRTNLVSGAWATLTGFNGPVTNITQATVTDLGATNQTKFYRIRITYP